MSMCAVNMQKYGAGDLGGIQSHNQRERPSRKNREIDSEKTYLNHDTVNAGDIDYRAKVKERIDGLNLKKAVRKDAVLYCSFIVSSDREFFWELGRREHIRRENEQTMVAIGLREPIDFDSCDPAYQAECIAKGSRPFFKDATSFFQNRFGEENVMNGTVHHDEPGAAHMHLGLVPVHEGRLSAKTLFTPASLRQLQTEFAAEVGEKYGLDRGKEGSTAKHLDELTFKLERRKAELAEVEQKLDDANHENGALGSLIQTAKQELKDLGTKKEALETSVATMKREAAALEIALNEGNRAGKQMYKDEWENRIEEARLHRALEEKVEQLEKKVSLYEQLLQSVPELWKQAQQLLSNLFRKKEKEKKQTEPTLGD